MSEIEQWSQIAAIFYEALPVIDSALSEANFPISERPDKAFELIQTQMLTVSDYKAFLLSDAHGRMRVIVRDWYQMRYGESASSDSHRDFTGMVMVHGTPFPLQVPKTFRIKADQPNQIWVGFPASVQAEEDPLSWVEAQDVIKRLSPADSTRLRSEAKATGDFIRSIQYDLHSLTYDKDQDIVDLAEQITADLQSSARHLCAGTNAGLRSSQWDVSQATEKALKLFMRRKGNVPPHSHDLLKLAERAEKLGSTPIDRGKLELIPSNSSATNIRYGGDVQLQDAVEAYSSAVAIVRDMVFLARPESQYNAREARFLLQKPPWFDFDSEGFLVDLHTAMDSSGKADG